MTFLPRFLMKVIIEHLDPKVFHWSLLEYKHISEVLGKENVTFTNIKTGREKLEGLGEIKEESVRDMKLEKVCILDPFAKECLSKDDSFDCFVFGGVLGNEPMDRRTEKEISNFFPDAEKRHLGKKQMSTDTAVIVCKKIVDDKLSFDDLEFIDEPEIKLDEGFSDILPYRYLKVDGEIMLPDGLLEYLKDEDKYIEEEELGL